MSESVLVLGSLRFHGVVRSSLVVFCLYLSGCCHFISIGVLRVRTNLKSRGMSIYQNIGLKNCGKSKFVMGNTDLCVNTHDPAMFGIFSDFPSLKVTEFNNIIYNII